MPHLVMSPFDFGKAQAHFGSTLKSSTHGSEEHSEGGQMEVNLVVAPKSQPIKLKVVSNTKIIFGATYVFSIIKGFVLVQTLASAKAKTHSSGTTNLTFLGIIVKDKHMTLMVGTDMEAEGLILVQIKYIIILVATTPSSYVALKDVGLNVKVDVIKAMVMEK